VPTKIGLAIGIFFLGIVAVLCCTCSLEMTSALSCSRESRRKRWPRRARFLRVLRARSARRAVVHEWQEFHRRGIRESRIEEMTP
jgi:hypothetical protein